MLNQFATLLEMISDEIRGKLRARNSLTESLGFGNFGNWRISGGISISFSFSIAQSQEHPYIFCFDQSIRFNEKNYFVELDGRTTAIHIKKCLMKKIVETLTGVPCCWADETKRGR